MIRLYSYWRSTAAYRVRIALNLKGIDYELSAVNLLRGEEQQKPYARLNPQKLVPALQHGGRILTQSMAIIEYLEEQFPGPALLPADGIVRADARALANAIASDIHPLNNLRVLHYLTSVLGAGDDAKLAWYRHWIAEGFAAIETQLQRSSNGHFCFGNTPGIADVVLIPQVYNARRFEIDLSPYPRIESINDSCLALDAFDSAGPENQPDAPDRF